MTLLSLEIVAIIYRRMDSPVGLIRGFQNLSLTSPKFVVKWKTLQGALVGL